MFKKVFAILLIIHNLLFILYLQSFFVLELIREWKVLVNIGVDMFNILEKRTTQIGLLSFIQNSSLSFSQTLDSLEQGIACMIDAAANDSKDGARKSTKLIAFINIINYASRSFVHVLERYIEWEYWPIITGIIVLFTTIISGYIGIYCAVREYDVATAQDTTFSNETQ